MTRYLIQMRRRRLANFDVRPSTFQVLKRSLTGISRLLGANVEEITRDPVLTTYAWAVVAGHFAVFLYFLDTHALSALRQDVEPLCWPFFESCWKYRVQNDGELLIVLFAYLFLIGGTFAALGSKRFNWFYAGLLATNIFLAIVAALDYRFRCNEFYMLFCLNVVFLCWPAKRWSVPLIIVSFYFWAGHLKLNWEWLSGAVLYHDLWWIPANLAWLACTYVVFLEMIMIWGLLAKRQKILWIAFAQLALFHLESLSQIHWFYPLLMATILSWFVIDRLIGDPAGRPTLPDLFRLRAPKAVYAMLALFAALQLVPLLYRGDSVLTGQGRIFGLHMFQARQVCEVDAVLHYANREPEQIDLVLKDLPPRTICDPVVYYSRIETICRSRSTNADLLDADLIMKARRTTDADFQTIVDQKDFCAKNFAYSVFSNNAWMK